MSDTRHPLFLERGSYRQRRLADAARMLPILGGVLLMLPLLWPRGADPDATPTSLAMIYIFGCWTALALAAFVLARWLDPTATEAKDES